MTAGSGTAEGGDGTARNERPDRCNRVEAGRAFCPSGAGLVLLASRCGAHPSSAGCAK